MIRNEEASSSADRNLLLGVLALQLEFVSEKQLINAMHDWIRDKTKSLAEILRKQDILDADTKQLLEALVAKHVSSHCEDPANSLRSLSIANPIADELSRIADSDVEASVAYLRSTTNEITVSHAQSVGDPTSAGLRYKILRPHARGGLGQVSVAFDSELRREVALKEILNKRNDDPESRARFLIEAEITGRLEHPGIVPIYGLGEFEDHRPFYAMRFIRGETFKKAVERFHHSDNRNHTDTQHSLEFRKLLRRFLDACNAISYAHSRGVLHRDLKPSNIMLGEFGETLVVDWGMAKVFGQLDEPATDEEATLPALGDAFLTVAGTALGTPQYMSPEQAAGEIDQVEATSDVYGLGATMYFLLTGTPPFSDKQIAVVLQKVQQGDFPKPRYLNPTIPPALEAICLRAMALKTTNRYESARLFATDVENWLADRPVSPWPAKPVIELTNLGKQIRGKWAINDVTLKIARGSIVGLFGGRDSGKTAIVSILTGQLRPSRGTALVLHQDCWRDRGALQDKIGFVPQTPRLYDWMTVAEIGWFTAGFQKPGYLLRFEKLAKDYEVDLNMRFTKLSPLQYATVTLILALALDPEILIVDGYNDSFGSAQHAPFLSRLKNFAALGGTVVLACRKTEELEAFVDHAAILDRGRLIAAAPTEELKRRIVRVTLRHRDNPPEKMDIGTVLHCRRHENYWEVVIEHPNHEAIDSLQSSDHFHDVTISRLSLAEICDAVRSKEKSR